MADIDADIRPSKALPDELRLLQSDTSSRMMPSRSRSFHACGTLFVLVTLILCASSFGSGGRQVSRRAWISRAVIATAGLPVVAANAIDDCFGECVKECSLIAPGAVNKPYCEQTCKEYCAAKAEEGGPSGKNDVVRQDLS